MLRRGLLETPAPDICADDISRSWVGRGRVCAHAFGRDRSRHLEAADECLKAVVGRANQEAHTYLALQRPIEDVEEYTVINQPVRIARGIDLCGGANSVR